MTPENVSTEIKQVEDSESFGDTKVLGKLPETPANSKMSSLYCIHCGKPLNAATHKCDFCETKRQAPINYSQIQRQSQHVVRPHTAKSTENNEMNNPRPSITYQHKGKKKKKNHTARNILIIVLIMMIIFAVSFFTFFRLLGGSFTPEEVTLSPKPEITESIVSTPTTHASAATTQQPSPTTKTAATKQPSSTQKSKKTQDEQVNSASKSTTSPSATSRPSSSIYIFPSSTELISEKDLENMSREEIKLAYYEIYARHGYTFNDDNLIEYFESQRWYVPTVSNEKDAEDKFNDYEWANIRMIENYQRKKGWRS